MRLALNVQPAQLLHLRAVPVLHHLDLLVGADDVAQVVVDVEVAVAHRDAAVPVDVDMIPQVRTGITLGRHEAGRIVGPQQVDLLDLTTPRVERLDVDVVHAGQVPGRHELIDLRHGLLHLDDLQVHVGIGVAAVDLQIEEAVDVGVGALVVGLNADRLVGFRAEAVQTEVDGRQPGVQQSLGLAFVQQRRVGADLSPQALLAAVGDHVEDALVHQRLAPDVQRGRLDVGRHLVHDGLEDVEVHVALRPLDLFQPGGAHDAVQVADVGRLDVHPVGRRHQPRLAGLVGHPLDGTQRLVAQLLDLMARLAARLGRSRYIQLR